MDFYTSSEFVAAVGPRVAEQMLAQLRPNLGKRPVDREVVERVKDAAKFLRASESAITGAITWGWQAFEPEAVESALRRLRQLADRERCGLPSNSPTPPRAA